jgi:hypothetical protein
MRGNGERGTRNAERGTRNFPKAALNFLLCAVLLSGCGAKKETEAPDRGIERTVERGRNTVVLRLDRQKPTVAQRVKLELEVKTAEDWKVTWPVIKDKLGEGEEKAEEGKEKPQEFQVVDQGERQPELLGDGRGRRVRNYVLEPFLPGTYTIPSLKFRLEKQGEEPQQLETEAVKVEVRSVEGPKDLPDILPPVRLREKWGWGWLGWLLGLLLLAGGGAFWWWWRRWQRQVEEAAKPRRPAHEIAFEELEALQAQDLPGKGLTKQYYQELSSILRRYVENRFGVHAPGQTTEEFLVYQSRSGILEPQHQTLLKGFLQHCDLVKFAELEAGPEQVRQAFEACRTFVVETRVPEQTTEEAVAAA